jgi:hypothetical protein
VTTPHKATPQQWANVRDRATDRDFYLSPVICELADRLAAAEQRIEALEAAASAPADHLRDAPEMVATDEELRKVWRLGGVTVEAGLRAVYNLGRQHGAAQAANSTPEQSPTAPAPARGLVERVMDEGYAVTHARAAILDCASWLETRGFPIGARRLREEVQRHG